MGAASATTVSAEEQKTVGILMPTQSSERWINDGANMKKQLEEKGYKVELQYAEDDTAMQVSQLENYVGKGVDCLVIAAIDSGVLVNAEAQAKEAGIPIIAYDRLLMDTDAVSYYATFDNKGVGTVIGNYIKDTKDLDAAREAGESYTIEFFMGSPDDNNALSCTTVLWKFFRSIWMTEHLYVNPAEHLLKIHVSSDGLRKQLRQTARTF